MNFCKTVTTNDQFITGFVKRAQENGLTQTEAEKLLKEASIGSWFRDWATNRADDIKEWWNDDLDLVQKAKAGWRGTVGTNGAKVWNWGDFGDHLSNIREEETQRMAPLFMQRALHKLQQNDSDGMLAAQRKFTSAVNRSTNLDFQRNQGNEFLAAVKPYQDKLNESAQYNANLLNSRNAIKATFSQPLLTRPTPGPTPAGVGFQVPSAPVQPGLDLRHSDGYIRNML